MCLELLICDDCGARLQELENIPFGYTCPVCEIDEDENFEEDEWDEDDDWDSDLEEEDDYDEEFEDDEE